MGRRSTVRPRRWAAVLGAVVASSAVLAAVASGPSAALPASKKLGPGSTWVLGAGAFCETDAFATGGTFTGTTDDATATAGTYETSPRARRVTMTWGAGGFGSPTFTARLRLHPRQYDGTIITTTSPSLGAVLSPVTGPACPSASASPSRPTVPLATTVTDTLAVTGNAGAGPTGTVSFFVCPYDYGPCTPTTSGAVALGDASLSGADSGSGATATSPAFTPTAIGQYCFLADYTGSPAYFGVEEASIADQCFTTTPAPSTLTTTPSPGQLTVGDGVVDSATVTSPATEDLGGSVDFGVCGPLPAPTPCPAAGAAAVGSPVAVTPGAPGTASATSATFSPATDGVYCFSATYTGDEDHAAASDDDTDECVTVSPAVTTVSLGGAENSLGTGGLALDAGGDATNVWAAINGYCTSKENGDEFASAFDATHDSQASPPDYLCSGTPGPDGGDPHATVNYEYNGADGSTAGYSYDIVTPSSTALGVTADPITVQAYDPAFEPAQCPGQPPVTDASPFHPAGGQTVDQPLGAGTASITTDYALYYSPVADNPSFDTFEPASFGAQGSNPFVAASGDTASCGQWVNLFTIPAGSPDGDYRLQVTTPQTAGQDSDGSNAYGLRAYEGPGACDGGSCPWTRCSTITTDADYAPTCPAIKGEQALSVYATEGSTASAGSQATCPSDAPAGATCGSFDLARIAPSYAGHVLEVNLFDPGEGDRDIELLDPDGQPVSFFWNVTDDCPLPPPNAGSTDCAQDLGFADNPGDNGVGTELPVDGIVTPPAGIVSNSEFNDRHLQLTYGIPDDYTADNGGWWKIEYVSQGGGITDRTTWSATLSPPISSGPRQNRKAASHENRGRERHGSKPRARPRRHRTSPLAARPTTPVL